MDDVIAIAEKDHYAAWEDARSWGDEPHMTHNYELEGCGGCEVIRGWLKIAYEQGWNEGRDEFNQDYLSRD